MTLGDTLSPSQILPDMQSRHHLPAIEELMNQLVASGRVDGDACTSILEALQAREEAMSTGIGSGVAIPHTSSEHVKEVIAAFGRSNQGIEFNSLDGQPVKLIVLFIVPQNQFQLHLRTLAAIAKFLNDRRTREELLAAPDTDAILTILRRKPGGH
jgi:fructose-specific phosphotransferase system IIA component